jgi:hypothetical protein
MRKLSLSKAARVLALKSVLYPDDLYYLRRIFRWYSRNFHTPLHVVGELPLEDVLEAYYEDNYEHLTSDDDPTKLTEELQELTETDQQRFRREMLEQSVELDDEEYLRQVMEEERAKTKNKLDKLEHNEKPPLTALGGVNSSSLPNLSNMPDIKVTYDENIDDLKKMDDWDVMGELFDDPKGRKNNL